MQLALTYLSIVTIGPGTKSQHWLTGTWAMLLQMEGMSCWHTPERWSQSEECRRHVPSYSLCWNPTNLTSYILFMKQIYGSKKQNKLIKWIYFKYWSQISSFLCICDFLQWICMWFCSHFQSGKRPIVQSIWSTHLPLWTILTQVGFCKIYSSVGIFMAWEVRLLSLLFFIPLACEKVSHFKEFYALWTYFHIVRDKQSRCSIKL